MPDKPKIKVYGKKEKKRDWRELLNSTPEENPVVGLLFVAVALVFVGGIGLTLWVTRDGPAPTTAATFEREVSADSYPSVYPVSIPSGTLVCGYGLPGQANDGSFTATWFRSPDGTMYPINGTADGANEQYGLGHPDIEEIWVDDPENPGLYLTLSDFNQDALALCN